MKKSRIEVRLSYEEIENIKKNSKNLNISMSEFIRLCGQTHDIQKIKLKLRDEKLLSENSKITLRALIDLAYLEKDEYEKLSLYLGYKKLSSGHILELFYKRDLDSLKNISLELKKIREE
jgi:hypothetical protein